MPKMNARPLISWLTLGLTALALSGCGGGDQVEKFRPSNIVSFGDESSAFAQETVGAGVIKGLKYTVNDLEVVVPALSLTPPLPTGATFVFADYPAYPSLVDPLPSPVAVAVAPFVADPATNFSVVKMTWTMGAPYIASGKTASDPRSIQPNTNVEYEYFFNCGATTLSASNRLWIQLLASSYGMSYASDCPLDTRAGAETFAQPGAKVADVITQITNNMSKIGGKTLATVLAGQNDVLEQYDAIFPSGAVTAPADGAIQTAENVLKSRAIQLAQAINGIADKRARTLVLTLPDLSYSPRVRAPSVNLKSERAAVMTRLVRAFNDALFSESGVRNDGRVIGRVKVYELIQEMATFPGSYGLINGTEAACATNLISIATANVVTLSTSADLKYCNDGTLIAGATAYNRLWAWDTWLSPAAHAAISNRAFQRADNDVF